jgi:hypothetical protein
VGMYKPISHERSLSMRKTPSPFRGGHIHDIAWSAHWLPLVFPNYYDHPVVMDPWIPIFSGRARIDEKVWNRVPSLSAAGTYALPKTVMCNQSSHQTYGLGTGSTPRKEYINNLQTDKANGKLIGGDERQRWD